MAEDKLDEWLLATVAEMCRVDRAQISLSTQIVEVGLDSMSLGIVISLFESQWVCELGDARLEQLFQIATLSDLVSILRDAAQSTETIR